MSRKSLEQEPQSEKTGEGGWHVMLPGRGGDMRASTAGHESASLASPPPPPPVMREASPSQKQRRD